MECCRLVCHLHFKLCPWQRQPKRDWQLGNLTLCCSSAQLSAYPSNPTFYCLIRAKTASFYCAQSQTSGSRNYTLLILKVGKVVNKNNFIYFFWTKIDLNVKAWLVWQQGCKIHMNAIGRSYFPIASLHKSIQNALSRKMSVNPNTTWCLGIINSENRVT